MPRPKLTYEDRCRKANEDFFKDILPKKLSYLLACHFANDAY